MHCKDSSIIFESDYKEGFAIINKIVENEAKEKAWDMYLATLPYMEKKMTFRDYYNKVNKPKITKSNKSTAELIEIAEKIKKSDQNDHSSPNL